MAWFDLSVDKLDKYKGDTEEPLDFDEFWNNTISKNELEYPIKAVYTKYDTHLKLVDVWDVSFAGFGGHSIAGWFIAPKNATGKLPCIVHYLGYGNGRGNPHEHLLFPNAGYCLFVMDTRGQGAMGGTGGDTADPVGSAPQVNGFMTKGILNKEEYYYRRLMTDAARAITAALTHPLVDASKLITHGGSQGGGLSLAASGLSKDVFASIIDVPFLCDYKRACTMVDSMPYAEISMYCKYKRLNVERVFDTLRYFDGVFFARRSKSRALFSVGLMDVTCPPSTVFAAYNNYAGEKEIRVYEFNNHEGGAEEHNKKKLEFLNRILS